MVTSPSTCPPDIRRPVEAAPLPKANSRHRGSSPPHQRRRRAPQPASRHGEHARPSASNDSTLRLTASELSITRVSNPKGGSASGASHNIVSATSASDSDSALQCAHVSRWSRTRDRLRPKGFLERIRSGRRSVPHTLLISRDVAHGSPSRSRLREACQSNRIRLFAVPSGMDSSVATSATVLPYITARTIARR